MSNIEQSHGGALEKAFASLSLQGETPALPSALSRPFNPFENLAEKHIHLNTFIQNSLIPHLDKHREIVKLSPDDDYFKPARELWKREGWQGNGLSNFIDLLCGSLTFPAILLLNPSPLDHLPWDGMIQGSPTLSWLRDVLKPLGLTLKEIVIIDTFPLLTEEKLEVMNTEKRRLLINEVFKLTSDFFENFQTVNIVSCQCTTNRNHPYWDLVENPIAEELGSSVRGALRQEVKEMKLNNSVVHIVQGFHPMHISREKDDAKSSNLDGNLRSILISVYQPCADWKEKQQRKSLEELRKAEEVARLAMSSFLDSLSEFREAERRLANLGIDTAGLGIPAESWEKFRERACLLVAKL